MTVLNGTADITNVGYNTAGNTALICKGTSLEVYGAKFVINVTSGPYVAYSPAYGPMFIGKNVNFTFEAVDDLNRPIAPLFVNIDE